MALLVVLFGSLTALLALLQSAMRGGDQRTISGTEPNGPGEFRTMLLWAVKPQSLVR
jgi:hypothetical protein